MRATAFLLCLGFLRAAALSPGDKAPLLEAQDSYGRPVDLRGSYVVLWFYPKAKSPGCTAQAKRYSELYPEFQRLGARVYGLSHDPAAEQCDFVEKLALRGRMIPDPEGRLARAYGVRSLPVSRSQRRFTPLVRWEGRSILLLTSARFFR